MMIKSKNLFSNNTRVKQLVLIAITIVVILFCAFLLLPKEHGVGLNNYQHRSGVTFKYNSTAYDVFTGNYEVSYFKEVPQHINVNQYIFLLDKQINHNFTENNGVQFLDIKDNPPEIAVVESCREEPNTEFSEKDNGTFKVKRYFFGDFTVNCYYRDKPDSPALIFKYLTKDENQSLLDIADSIDISGLESYNFGEDIFVHYSDCLVAEVGSSCSVSHNISMYSTDNVITVERITKGFYFKVFVVDSNGNKLEQSVTKEIFHDFKSNEYVLLKDQEIYILDLDTNQITATGGVWRHTEGYSLIVKAVI